MKAHMMRGRVLAAVLLATAKGERLVEGCTSSWTKAKEPWLLGSVALVVVEELVVAECIDKASQAG